MFSEYVLFKSLVHFSSLHPRFAISLFYSSQTKLDTHRDIVTLYPISNYRWSNNGMRMWNTMNCFTSEVKIVAIDKVCWEAKMKDWDYINSISFWDNVQNDFNIKYMYNNKQKRKTSRKIRYCCMSSSNVLQNPKNALYKINKIHH